MALYVSNTAVALNNSIVVPGIYASRAALPTGAADYLAYVADQDELVVQRGTNPWSTGPSAGVLWHKFLVKPNDYKNETILEQGTVGGGYIGSSVWNTISRVIHSNDVTSEMQQTLSFTNNYGGWHSTEKYAYYHQGGGTAANKQDWSTLTVSTINSRPSASTSPNSLNPGPKGINTIGLILIGTSSSYLTFSSDTWTTGGYNPPTSQSYGGGTAGESYGYTYTYGSSVAYLNWSNSTWTNTSSGNHVNGAGNYGKILGTKWNKFYYIGDNTNATLTVSVFNMATNSWSNAGSDEPYPQSEGSQVMGQDWGYMLGGYGPGGTWNGQNEKSLKTFYATNTTMYNPVSNGLRALSSGSGCWGPLP